MSNEDTAAKSNLILRGPLACRVVQSASDPNRPWQLIIEDTVGNEYRRIGFRTYGEAWRAAEHRKSNEDAYQADLLIGGAQHQERRPSAYKTDILTWSEHQAALLRRLAAAEKVTDQIDWENVIEEVESAGRRHLALAKSLLAQALVCMLKVQAWPGSPEVPHWRTEALGLQRDAADIIAPSMRRRIDINALYFKAIRHIPKRIDGREPLPFPTECPVTLDDLLGD